MLIFMKATRGLLKICSEKPEEEAGILQEETVTPGMDFSSVTSTINNIQDTEEIFEESLSLADKEVEMIKKALEKYNGKRKMAANVNLGFRNGHFIERLKNMELNHKEQSSDFRTRKDFFHINIDCLILTLFQDVAAKYSFTGASISP